MELDFKLGFNWVVTWLGIKLGFELFPNLQITLVYSVRPKTLEEVNKVVLGTRLGFELGIELSF